MNRQMGAARVTAQTANASTHQKLPRYMEHTLSYRQRAGCIAASAVLFFGIGYLFYHHWALGLLLSAAALLTPKYYNVYLLNKRREALSLHFKQALYSLSSSLAAGKSVENAFREAVHDLRMLDPQADHDLIKELMIICTRMEYGEPIEDALRDFADRAQMEDITNFADVFVTCKRTGGDLVEVVRRTSSVIGEKLDIKQEIAVTISQKKFESKAMFAAPFLFLIFLSLTSPDFLTPLYTGAGYIISSIALLILFGCFIWVQRIMDVRV